MTRRPVEVRGHSGEFFSLGLAAVLGGGFAVLWAAVAAGRWLAGDPVPANPFAVPVHLATGELAWPGPASTAVLVLLLTLVVAVLVLVLTRRIRHAGRSVADAAATRMAHSRELGDLTPAAAATKARRLRAGGVGDDATQHGIRIGRTARKPHTVLRSSWEDVSVDIWGPRRGKTSTRAIPAVLDAPGPVLATSNKRDLLDATRAARETRGEVFVFDPQGLATDTGGGDLGEGVAWFDPLSVVGSVTDAEALVGIFRAAETDADARKDAYFDSAGDALLAGLFLAAARDGRSLVDVYGWLMDSEDATPAEILAIHGDVLPEKRVRAVLATHEKQRDGVYGTAQTMLRSVADPARARWVVPGPGPELVPATFVTSDADTLYLLSQEGPGSSAALVGALAQAVLDQAVRVASGSSSGRLDPPLLACLDEAANVCRLPRLPDLYSHLGSRGVPVMAFLQSYRQGVRVWGETGMDALWSAATIRVYGGGVADTRFLDSLSQLVGEHEVLVHAQSRSRRDRTRSEQRHRERTLTVADLGHLPPGRTVLFAANSRPAVLQAEPWWTTEHCGFVETSLARYEPHRTEAPP
jgi:type IV secretory pathway TraG/TraD family ATPase VirD4